MKVVILIAIFLFTSQPFFANADPITASGTFFFRKHQSWGDVTDKLIVGFNNLSPSLAEGTIVTGTNGIIGPIKFNKLSTTTSGGAKVVSSYHIDKLGIWTMTITNGSDTAILTSPELTASTLPLPFVSNVEVTGEDTFTPKLTWILPVNEASTPFKRVRAWVYNSNNKFIGKTESLPADTTTIILPEGIISSNGDFWMEILLEDTNSDKRTINRSSFRVDMTINKPDSASSEVQNTTGQLFSITPIDVQIPTTSGTVPDTTVLLTLKDSSTTLKRDDDSIIEVKPETIVVLNPSIEATNSNTLIRGEVTTIVDCTNANDYEVRTALADIKVPGSCSSIQRADNTAKFTTQYSQEGIDGKLTVKVISGTVDVTDREGNITTLNAGQEITIQNKVPRTSWVLPIDHDKLYGGYDNLFIWTEYLDADSYLLEFNIPEPVFFEENPGSAEFQQQTVVLTSDFYFEYDGLLIFTLPLPKGFDGIVLEVRLFALDKQGNIIDETVASDRSTITVTD
ncbi:MAG: FecR family protein [gamma proteobacterium symbiont of Taylorina sp.]|nr:FecR family protein [gamma proteobacterium symbiont of Taylorina sp.]